MPGSLDPSAPHANNGSQAGQFGQELTAGEALSQGQPIRLGNASGASKMYRAQGSASSPAANCIGLVATDVASDAKGFGVRLGFCLAPAARWNSAPSTSDIGALVFLSNTVGKLTLTGGPGGAIGVVQFSDDGVLGVDVGCIGSRYTPY